MFQFLFCMHLKEFKWPQYYNKTDKTEKQKALLLLMFKAQRHFRQNFWKETEPISVLSYN
jgi:hypothetical protein